MDSSDTKGVSLIHNRSALTAATLDAMDYSRSKTIILEEYIDAGVANLHGDGFVKDGQLVFCLLGDLLYTSASNPLKPSATKYPGSPDNATMSLAINEISRAISLSGLRDGPVNIEARISGDGKVYIMEIGPRSGGSLTPQIIFYSSGFDMLGASFDSMLGNPISIPEKEAEPVLGFTVHTNKNGIFDGIILDEVLAPFLVEKHIYVTPGDQIKSYLHAGSSIGVYISKFDHIRQLNNLIKNDLYEKLVDSVRLI